MTASSQQQSGIVSDFGEQARLRMERLRAHIGDVATRANLNRDTVSAVFNGGGSKTSRGKVHDALTAMEQEAGVPPAPIAPEPLAPPTDTPHVVRFEVQGVYGAKALIVEGPVDDLPALEAAVDRIMRRLAAGEPKDD